MTIYGSKCFGVRVLLQVLLCQRLYVYYIVNTENEMNRPLGHLHIQAKLDQENILRIVKWVRWHCPPDTRFKIQTLEVWGRTRYFSVTESPNNTEFFTSGWRTSIFVSFKPPRPGNENSGMEGSCANHYPRGPALSTTEVYLLHGRFFSRQ